MQDSITIRDLEFWTRIGCSAEERAYPQRVLISVRLTCDLIPSGESDRLEDTIDYSEVAERIMELASEERRMVEKLCADVARCVLFHYPVRIVQVSVRKFAVRGTREIVLDIVRDRSWLTALGSKVV